MKTKLVIRILATTVSIMANLLTAIKTDAASQTDINDDGGLHSVAARHRGIDRPRWSEIDFPPNCRFASLAPKADHVVYTCGYGSKALVYSAVATDAGKLTNYRLWHEKTHKDIFVGYTLSDSKRVVNRNGQLIKIDDQTLQETPLKVQPALTTEWVSAVDTRYISSDGIYDFAWSCPTCDDLATVSRLTRDVVTRVVTYTFIYEGVTSWSFDNRMVGYVADHHIAIIADLQTFKLTNLLTVNRDLDMQVAGVSFSPVDMRVAVRTRNIVTNQSQVLIYDLASKSVTTFTVPLAHEYYSSDFEMLWSPDGKRMIVRGFLPGDEEGNFYLMDVRTGKLTKLPRDSKVGYPKGVLAWTKDGRSLLAIGRVSKSISSPKVERLYFVEVAF